MLHRTLFYLGFVVTVIVLYVTATSTPNELSNLGTTNPVLEYAFVLFGLFVFFYAYILLFSLLDVVKKRRKRALMWIGIVIVLPFAGPYIYFERHLYPTYFRPRTPEEKAIEQAAIRDMPNSTGWRRPIAAIVDYGIFFSFMFVYVWTTGTPVEDKRHVATGILPLLTLLFVWFAFFPLAEGLWGRTLGKAIVGVRVTMTDGRKVTFIASLKRHSLDIFDMILFGLIVIPRRHGVPPRRLGDRWAHTLVVLRDKTDQRNEDN